MKSSSVERSHARNTRQNWFDVDKEGLARVLARRGKAFIIYELVQNAWDEDATCVSIRIESIGPGLALLEVEDDCPEGFNDLAHAYTLFAGSHKAVDASTRGRFDLGEKLVLGLCLKASIASTIGTVIFDSDGRRMTRECRPRGSCFSGVLSMTPAEIDACTEAAKCLLVPRSVRTRINGLDLVSRTPFAEFTATLPTEVADAGGYLRRSQRKSRVEIYAAQTGERTRLYELGIPVVETDGRFHINVMQKVPLSFDRDNVPPAYLSKLRAHVIDTLRDHLTTEDANATWVRDALETHAQQLDAATITRLTDLRFGSYRVSFDPSDQEANQRASALGYTVVHGPQMSAQEWEAARRAKAILPAGQVTPSPKPFAENGEPLEYLESGSWSQELAASVRYIERVSERLIGHPISVRITNTRNWPFAAAYGKATGMILNTARLERGWAEGPLAAKNRILIHELAHHTSANHLSAQYHEALCRLGAELTSLALTEPKLFEQR